MLTPSALRMRRKCWSQAPNSANSVLELTTERVDSIIQIGAGSRPPECEAATEGRRANRDPWSQFHPTLKYTRSRLRLAM